MVEKIGGADGSVPIRTVVFGLLSVSTVIGLGGENELGGLITRLGDPTLETDYFRTLLDTLFLSYAGNVLLSQAGIIEQSPTASDVSLNEMECTLTLDIGRLPGTWMPPDWAASGARLSLPVSVRFTDEVVDLGFPGEETLNPSGGRYAKKLYCEGGSFVGANGITNVRASGGAWNAEPSGVPGASSLNFFIDFAEGAVRNDVTLPAGRVFFSGACWDSEEALPPGLADGAIPMPQPGAASPLDAEPAGVVGGPGGVQLLDKGGLSIKRSDWRNVWGAFGDGFFILGKFRVTAPPKPKATPESAADAELREVQAKMLETELRRREEAFEKYKAANDGEQ